MVLSTLRYHVTDIYSVFNNSTMKEVLFQKKTSRYVYIKKKHIMILPEFIPAAKDS